MAFYKPLTMNGKQLKNSILQWAIQGKLVPQDPSEGTADELLQQIRAEKEKLVEEKKLKKNIATSSEIEDSSEFPTTWQAVRMNEVCLLLDGNRKTGNGCLLDAKYLRGKTSPINIDGGKFVSKGDNIILVDGENSGEVFTVPHDGYMGSTFKQLWINPAMDTQYMLTYIRFYKDILRNSKKGAAIPHLNKELFNNIVVGIPPLAEQRRIISQLERMFKVLEEE